MDLAAWHQQYETLYGAHIAAGHYQKALLGISVPGNWAGVKIPLLDTAAIDRKLVQLDRAGKDIYFRVVPLKPGVYGPGERAGADRNDLMPAAWGDGDTRDGEHKPFRGEFKGFPHPTTDQVLDMYEDVLPPSMANGSGGGVHPYWLHATPLENACGHNASMNILRRIDYAMKQAAKERGFGMDTGITSDPARILRVAGSMNYKRKNDPRPVTVLTNNPGIVYTFEQLDAMLPHIPKAEPKRSIATSPKRTDRKQGNSWSAQVPVSFLMEAVWGMNTTDGDADTTDYRRWVYPREDGTASQSDRHAKTFLSERGVEYVVAYGGRIQDEWDVNDFRTALTSWDLLLTCLGGNMPLARFMAKEFPEPSLDLVDNLVAANETRHGIATA